MSAVMECEEVHEYLAERLAGSLSDRLSETVYSHVRTHILSCPECREEMEHLEEMQRRLQTLPVEPCDSDAMRARFRMLMGPKGTEPQTRNVSRFAVRIRPSKIAIVSIVSILSVMAIFLAARQAMKWMPVARVTPPLSAPVIIPSPKAVETSAGVPISPAPLGMAEITGQVLFQDGSEVSDKQSLGKITITPTGNSTGPITITIDANGRFVRTITAGEYRFRIAEFPGSYLIQSMTAGGVDLLNAPLQLSGSSTTAVEIWVARKTDKDGGKVIGRVLDSATNAPSQADGVVLCCFPSGPAERISTPLHSDGSFEFDGIPSGSYTAELRASRKLTMVNPEFNVAAAGVTNLKFISVPELVVIDVTLRLDNGGRLPYWPDTSIVFVGTTGPVRVVATCVVGNLFRASVPANESYVLSVTNVAAGYSVQSIVDSRMTDLMHGAVFDASGRSAGSPRIVVTLVKN
jgi:hypothetical protein